MSSHTIEDLTSCILDFQANIIRVTYRKKTTLVEANVEVSHATALRQIWAASKLTESSSSENWDTVKWRKLGFESEDLTLGFGEVGVLGLDCLVCPYFLPITFLVFSFFLSVVRELIGTLQRNFVQSNPESFAQVHDPIRNYH